MSCPVLHKATYPTGSISEREHFASPFLLICPNVIASFIFLLAHILSCLSVLMWYTICSLHRLFYFEKLTGFSVPFLWRTSSLAWSAQYSLTSKIPLRKDKPWIPIGSVQWVASETLLKRALVATWWNHKHWTLWSQSVLLAMLQPECNAAIFFSFVTHSNTCVLLLAYTVVVSLVSLQKGQKQQMPMFK